jgi:hypothetical protein
MHVQEIEKYKVSTLIKKSNKSTFRGLKGTAFTLYYMERTKGDVFSDRIFA